jgi:hypothetical protein
MDDEQHDPIIPPGTKRYLLLRVNSRFYILRPGAEPPADHEGSPRGESPWGLAWWSTAFHGILERQRKES